MTLYTLVPYNINHQHSEGINNGPRVKVFVAEVSRTLLEDRITLSKFNHRIPFRGFHYGLYSPHNERRDVSIYLVPRTRVAKDVGTYLLLLILWSITGTVTSHTSLENRFRILGIFA